MNTTTNSNTMTYNVINFACASVRTLRAIRKYGEKTCLEAYRLCEIGGNGASTVGCYLGLTTRQADAAINAGRELVTGRAAA